MSPVYLSQLFLLNALIELVVVLQEDAEAARLKEERLAEYAAKKAKST